MSPSKPRQVAIVAAGVISPLGRGLEATAHSLRSAVDCVSPVTSFDVSKTRCSTAGQVLDSWMDDLRASRPGRRLHRSSLMMMAAAQELRKHDGEYEPELLVIGTTSGGMTFGEAFYRALAARQKTPLRAAWLANYNPQKPVLDAQEFAGFPAGAHIIANACASGTNAIGHAFQLIRSGQKKAVLCGGYDAISEMVFGGFDALQASTAEKIRPFDAARSGLVLGEGAALLALEDAEQAADRGARVLGLIAGYGISTDNHHLTQPHPSGIGPRLAMERALASAGCGAARVDYINAHGTATTFNDATEGLAIAGLFGNRVPVSSTKSQMGHSLGAAGAIEAVISLLALQMQVLPPNLNFSNCDPAWELDIVANEPRAARVGCVLSNSFGFGGTNASVLIEAAA